MKATCALLQMIYEKNQSPKRSGDWRQEALEEQKGRYQSSQPGNREFHAGQLLCVLGWRWGCNRARVTPTLAVSTERLGIPTPFLGRVIMWKYGKKIRLKGEKNKPNPELLKTFSYWNLKVYHNWKKKKTTFSWSNEWLEGVKNCRDTNNFPSMFLKYNLKIHPYS